jgi:hypothetical protein
LKKKWHEAFTGGKSWPGLVVKLHAVQWSRRKTVRARFLIWLGCKRKTLVPFAYLGRWIIETMESSTISSKECGSRCNGKVLIAATRVCYCITSTPYIYIYIDADLLATRLAVHTTTAVRWWGAHAHWDHILEMPPLACSGLRPTNREWFLFFVYGWPCMHHHVLESFHVVLESFQKLHRLVKFLLYFLESFQKLHCRMPYNRFFLFRRW